MIYEETVEIKISDFCKYEGKSPKYFKQFIINTSPKVDKQWAIDELKRRMTNDYA